MYLVLVIVVGFVALIAVLYTRLVRDCNRVDAAWSYIDVHLQRRHDLIPQVVESVRQYASYERATLEAIMVLRAEAMKMTDPSDIDARGKKEEQLGAEVHRLLAVAENYPDLKANENFLSLQNELVETENYLQFARRFYNGSVRQFNTRVETVPANMVAGWFGFTQRGFSRRHRTTWQTFRWSRWGR